MRKVLLLSAAVLLVVSVYLVTAVSAGENKIGAKENVVIRIKGDATEANGDDWLYVGSGDEEKKIDIKKKSRCSAYLGIYMDELSRKLKRTYDYPKKDGVLIIEIVEDSPAEEAGLEENDIIFLFDGEEVESAKQLSTLVKEKDPGDEVDIIIYRDGDEKKVKVVLGEYPYEVSIDVDDFEDYAEEIGDFAGKLGKSIEFWWHDFGAKGRLGMELSNLDEELAEYFDVEGNEGILVLRVHEDSPAEEAGVKAGDVIINFNGEEVSEVEDVIDKLGDLEDETVELEIVRKGKKQMLTVELKDRERLYVFPRSKEKRIVIPPKSFESIDRIELEKELEELKKELKELKKRLKEIEKE
jgi:C-terminal processing protease CtpA/Prc